MDKNFVIILFAFCCIINATKISHHRVKDRDALGRNFNSLQYNLNEAGRQYRNSEKGEVINTKNDNKIVKWDEDQDINNEVDIDEIVKPYYDADELADNDTEHEDRMLKNNLSWYAKFKNYMKNKLKSLNHRIFSEKNKTPKNEYQDSVSGQYSSF